MLTVLYGLAGALTAVLMVYLLRLAARLWGHKQDPDMGCLAAVLALVAGWVGAWCVYQVVLGLQGTQ
jgi:hypothetical protein